MDSENRRFVMKARDLLPWNWHSKDVAVHRPEGDSFSELQTNINRVFEGFLTAPNLIQGSASGFLPALDVVSDDEGLHVTLELAGMDEKDIDVSVDNDILAIRGEKRSERRGTAFIGRNAATVPSIAGFRCRRDSISTRSTPSSRRVFCVSMFHERRNRSRSDDPYPSKHPERRHGSND
jgi:HSP20 family molecular chaperone IbpA